MELAVFFSEYGLILLLGALLVFMFWSSRRRMQRQKAEQETKARQTVPGAEVLLQGGLYGTIVAYDPENLDQPAIVEIAPGVEIKVHSQAILRVVDPADDVVAEDEYIEAEDEAAEGEYITDAADAEITSVEDDRNRASGGTNDTDPGTKPLA